MKLEAKQRLSAAPKLQDFKFHIRVVEENGQEGSFDKTVEAKDVASAWLLVTKQLQASTLLKYVRTITAQR